MPIIQHPSENRIPTPSPPQPHSWPFLRCCAFADHLGLLAELERDGLEDADVRALLPRARILLAGRTDEPSVTPWWTR